MNAKLVKVTKRFVPLATAIVATTLVMKQLRSGLDENSTNVEVGVTRAASALVGAITFGAVAMIVENVIDDLTTEEVKNVVEVITDEIK
jgi:hypothetical protein